MKTKLPVKIADIVIILLALGLTLFSGFTVYARPKNIPQVVIHGPDGSWVFPVNAEETVRVRGILGGDTVVRISGSQVWAESSPCENQICVGMGRISSNSVLPWVACLPNNVMFMIEGTNDSGNADSTVW